MQSIEETLAERSDHARLFREKFPDSAASIDSILEAAPLFSLMLLGADEGAWTEDDRGIAQILKDAECDLRDAVEELYLGRLKFAMVAIRCFLEQLFFSLYYHEQCIEFALWQRSHDNFVMLHQLYQSNHPFRRLCQSIFEDRRDPEWREKKFQGVFSKLIFKDLEGLYGALSQPVHGRPLQRESTPRQLSSLEVALFCGRLNASVCIAMEFFDIVGTGAEEPPEAFRYDLSVKVK